MGREGCKGWGGTTKDPMDAHQQIQGGEGGGGEGEGLHCTLHLCTKKKLVQRPVGHTARWGGRGQLCNTHTRRK